MKTIKLNSNGVGRYEDVSPFIMAGNMLEIKTELPNTNGEFFFIAENNGKTFKKFISRDKPIVLDGLSTGELQAEIKHYLKGVLIKNYQVEPLIISEVDSKVTVMPEIAELKAELTELKENINKLEETAQEREKAVNKQIEKLNKNITALLKFAVKDYQYNVYLDGGSLEDFVNEFCPDLDEKQIKIVSGGDLND